MHHSSTSIYQIVQAYKAQGLDPLPIPYIDGEPTKRPTQIGWQRAAENGYTVEDFVSPCNVGVLLGGGKNLADIDADSLIAVAIAPAVLSRKLPNTRRFGRKSKPRSHSIYFCDAPVVSESIKDPITGETIIELRSLNKDGSRGRQTVFPPSLYYNAKTGVTEQIEFDPHSSTEIATVPTRQLIEVVRFIGAAALLARHFPVTSNRHTTILALAGILARANKPVKFAVELICTAYKHSTGYNDDIDKVKSDVEGVFDTFHESPGTHLYGYPAMAETMPKKAIDKALQLIDIEYRESPQEQREASYPLTDSGNAQWLVDNHGDHVRFCPDAGAWFRYNGVRWEEGDTAIRELAKSRGKALREQIALIQKPELTGDVHKHREAQKQFDVNVKALANWSNRSENAEGIKGTLFAAASDPRIIGSRSEFDQQPHLLNAPNGVIDLYSGELLKHDAKFMLTKLCPTEYHPDASHPVWDSTLAAITRKHPDLPSFLQLFAGYSVQGNKVEERIFSLHGPGGTGKGTFNDAISSTLGDDYVRAIAPETVLRQNRNSAAASGDIARLEGARIVIVSELEKGNRVQESFLKLASGNDFVVARGLFKSERQFRPTWQFWFQTNNRLGFDSTDSGNLRRYVEIPFDNVLGHDLQIKFDRNLKSWMRSNDEFHCTVLVWIVAGCVRWRQEGMKIPVSVQRATQELFASNDFLRDFINERCVVGPTEKELVSKVIAEYVAFCVEQGEEPARGRTFNHMLEERGFCRKQATVRGTNGKAWIGIRLKTAKELERDGFVDVTESEKRPRKPNDKATLDDYFDADQSLAG